MNNFLSVGLRWVLGVRSFVFFKALCIAKNKLSKNFLPNTLLFFSYLSMQWCLLSYTCILAEVQLQWMGLVMLHNYIGCEVRRN